MALAAATREMSPRFVSNTLSFFICAWFCAADRLLPISCFPFSRVLLLKHIQPNILFIIESHKQLPFAEFHFPALRFNPWQIAFERACLSKFVTILLFVFILCTDRGVTLVGSSVLGVV